MRRNDGLIGTFGTVLAIATVLNYLCGVFFAVVLIASVAGGDPLATRLAAKYGPTNVKAMVDFFRVLMVVGLIAVAAVSRLFSALGAILTSVAESDPFAAVNAARLRTIGWMLLVLQLLDIAVGVASWWLSRLGAEVLDWTPSFTGWLAVLVAFILARVFTVGARMRDELEGTV